MSNQHSRRLLPRHRGRVPSPFLPWAAPSGSGRQQRTSSPGPCLDGKQHGVCSRRLSRRPGSSACWSDGWVGWICILCLYYGRYFSSRKTKAITAAPSISHLLCAEFFFLKISVIRLYVYHRRTKGEKIHVRNDF